MPERWLKADNKTNLLHINYAFGLGARMCPASFLTYRLLYLTLIRLLWSYTFHPSPTSKAPEDDPIKGATSSASLGTPPDPYDVVLKPRNLAALRQILGEKPSAYGQ
jgi:3-hydroxyphenylacetate 6-hydroxylase